MTDGSSRRDIGPQRRILVHSAACGDSPAQAERRRLEPDRPHPADQGRAAGLRGDRVRGGQRREDRRPASGLEIWNRWDAPHYLDLARYGYNAEGPGDVPLFIVFYPLYPWLTGAVNAVLGDPVVSGFLVTTVASVFVAPLLCPGRGPGVRGVGGSQRRLVHAHLPDRLRAPHPVHRGALHGRRAGLVPGRAPRATGGSPASWARWRP